MSEHTTGSCLCHSVQYVIKEDINAVTNCHCNTCKKITGAAFETIAVVSDKNLEITEGINLITTYQITKNAQKHFCSICGTPIYNINNKYPGRCMVLIGSLDDPSSAVPTMNIFCESMFPWVKDICALKNFEQFPRK